MMKNYSVALALLLAILANAVRASKESNSGPADLVEKLIANIQPNLGQHIKLDDEQLPKDSSEKYKNLNRNVNRNTNINVVGGGSNGQAKGDGRKNVDLLTEPKSRDSLPYRRAKQFKTSTTHRAPMRRGNNEKIQPMSRFDSRENDQSDFSSFRRAKRGSNENIEAGNLDLSRKRVENENDSPSFRNFKHLIKRSNTKPNKTNRTTTTHRVVIRRRNNEKIQPMSLFDSRENDQSDFSSFRRAKQFKNIEAGSLDLSRKRVENENDSPFFRNYRPRLKPPVTTTTTTTTTTTRHAPMRRSDNEKIQLRPPLELRPNYALFHRKKSKAQVRRRNMKTMQSAKIYFIPTDIGPHYVRAKKYLTMGVRQFIFEPKNMKRLKYHVKKLNRDEKIVLSHWARLKNIKWAKITWGKKTNVIVFHNAFGIPFLHISLAKNGLSLSHLGTSVFLNIGDTDIVTSMPNEGPETEFATKEPETEPETELATEVSETKPTTELFEDNLATELPDTEPEIEPELEKKLAEEFEEFEKESKMSDTDARRFQDRAKEPKLSISVGGKSEIPTKKSRLSDDSKWSNTGRKRSEDSAEKPKLSISVGRRSKVPTKKSRLSDDSKLSNTGRRRSEDSAEKPTLSISVGRRSEVPTKKSRLSDDSKLSNTGRRRSEDSAEKPTLSISVGRRSEVPTKKSRLSNTVGRRSSNGNNRNYGGNVNENTNINMIGAPSFLWNGSDKNKSRKLPLTRKSMDGFRENGNANVNRNVNANIIGRDSQ